MLTIYGAAAVTFMMLMYALETRGRGFLLAFAGGCVASSIYGFLAGTWPFGVVELIWAGIALDRYRRIGHKPGLEASRRGAALVELAAAEFPREVEVAGDADSWPLVGASLVSRMTGTMKVIDSMEPGKLEADAGVAVRTLFEHTLYFAWLAADPSADRIRAWRKSDLRSRLAADRDARDHGIELFDEEQRARLEREESELEGGRLVLTDLAEDADRYWAGRLPGMGGEGEVKSWRGFYAIVYRNYSGFAHPTLRGLNTVVNDLGGNRRRVRLENPFEGSGPYGMASVIFGLGLLIAAEALGWPDRAEIEEVFERFR